MQSEEALAVAPAPEVRLVLQRVRLLARLRAEWLRRLWRSEGASFGPAAVGHAEVDSALADRDAPEAEAEWRAAAPELKKLRGELASVEKKLAGERDSRLARLRQIFGLGTEESDLLQACLALALDPALARVYAYLQDHAGRAYVTEELAARLFAHARARPWGTESALRRWELITEKEVAPGEPPVLACDPQVYDWFCGRHELDRLLVGAARLYPPHKPLEPWAVGELSGFFERVLQAKSASPARLTLAGPPGSGRRTLAAVVASRLGLPLLVINADLIEEQDWRHACLHAERQAFLDRCALAWQGESLHRRAWPLPPSPFPVQFVIAEQGQPPAPAVAGVVEQTYEMPALTTDERRRLWLEYLPAAKRWPAAQLEALATRYRASVGDIASAGAKGLAEPDEAARAVREAARGRLGSLAQLLECPFGWDDLIVNGSVREALEDFVYEARTRVAFWEEPRARRLFPQGRALLALFSGPPGTGKTMAAQVIAAQLGLDLFRIDLSAVISKYVGETSQNIERMLTRAAAMDVVLFFDEADALFGKRTAETHDAQDRFVNMDTSHLMVSIESYSGVVLMATNLKSNIDPAFLRRIRYGVGFQKPDAAQRLEIWRRVVGALAGAKALDALSPDLGRLAEVVEATGSQIKYAVLAAVFVARREGVPLGLVHLLRGLNRELSKEGRPLTDREREKLLRDAAAPPPVAPGRSGKRGR